MQEMQKLEKKKTGTYWPHHAITAAGIVIVKLKLLESVRGGGAGWGDIFAISGEF
jgi:hypothetical protein